MSNPPADWMPEIRSVPSPYCETHTQRIWDHPSGDPERGVGYVLTRDEDRAQGDEMLRQAAWEALGR